MGIFCLEKTCQRVKLPLAVSKMASTSSLSTMSRPNSRNPQTTSKPERKYWTFGFEKLGLQETEGKCAMDDGDKHQGSQPSHGEEESHNVNYNN